MVQPFNVISEFMGMNVRVPFQYDVVDSLWAFWFIIGLAAFISSLIYLNFMRIKWV